MTSVEHLKELERLIGEAGKNYYERTSHISALLEDANWVRSSFSGDDYKAAETLESKYLHDLSGTVSVFQLLTIFRRFPNEKDWKAEGYHIRKLLQKCKPEPTESRGSRTSIKVSDYEAVVQQSKENLHKAKALEKQLVTATESVESLKKQNEKFRMEIERLKGRIEELESILSKRFGKVA